MSSPEKGPLARLVGVAWSMLLIAVLLWVTFALLQEIWIWLLIAVLIATTVWVFTAISRWHRNRW